MCSLPFLCYKWWAWENSFLYHGPPKVQQCPPLHREGFNAHRSSWSRRALSIISCCSTFSPWAESSFSCSSVLLWRRREASCSVSSSCCRSSSLVFSRFAQSLQRQSSVRRRKRPEESRIPFSSFQDRVVGSTVRKNLLFPLQGNWRGKEKERQDLPSFSEKQWLGKGMQRTEFRQAACWEGGVLSSNIALKLQDSLTIYSRAWKAVTEGC